MKQFLIYMALILPAVFVTFRKGDSLDFRTAAYTVWLFAASEIAKVFAA